MRKEYHFQLHTTSWVIDGIDLKEWSKVDPLGYKRLRD
jgi:hypothetical protein